jgi:hypothetical protein
MRLGGIGTRYAVWIAALALLLVATALLAAGFLGFRESRLVQSEIHAAVAAARSADEEEALRRTAVYLGAHLFNALYQLDVERLNDDIQQIRTWLPVSSFLVVDRDDRVLTDGTPANARYGDIPSGPRPGDGPRSLLLTDRGEETEIRFAIASGGITAGWGIVTLRGGPWQASLRRLEGRTSAMWAGHRSSLLYLGAVAFAVSPR